MQTIQIKIDNQTQVFNNEIEVISFMADRLQKNKLPINLLREAIKQDKKNEIVMVKI
jgi:hypothetical protein